ncbi:MAG: GNAT family N-acetyltransferase, partial [Thermoproteota archaeon]|nr:GNAT family N-acetyltransferase [Thermoproteota archaeon]
MSSSIEIHLMRQSDIPQADRIMRLAFGTFLGLADPLSFMGDTSYVKTRYIANPSAALVAEVDGKLAGSNFALNWGSVGIFGPLTIHPDLWNKGVAKRLLEKTMELFDRWKIKHAGLFTFAQSIKHIHLYQNFGFWPRFLTSIMSKTIGQTQELEQSSYHWSRFSELNSYEKTIAIEECRDLTNQIYNGLNLEMEIYSVEKQRLGDTILLREDNKNKGTLTAMAICHCGPGTEAGSGTCYVKFGAVRPSPDSTAYFDDLLAVCESFAESQQLSRVSAGVN